MQKQNFVIKSQSLLSQKFLTFISFTHNRNFVSASTGFTEIDLNLMSFLCNMILHNDITNIILKNRSLLTHF